MFAVLSLKPLTSILSPVYWTTATEVGKAANGFTLTQGNFVKESQVEFATGLQQSLHFMTSYYYLIIISYILLIQFKNIISVVSLLLRFS